MSTLKQLKNSLSEATSNGIEPDEKPDFNKLNTEMSKSLGKIPHKLGNQGFPEFTGRTDKPYVQKVIVPLAHQDKAVARLKETGFDKTHKIVSNI